MDTLNKNKDKKKKVESVAVEVEDKKKKEESVVVVVKEMEEEVGKSSMEVDDTKLTSAASVDERLDEQLDSMSLGSITSASSSILNTPKRSSVQQVQATDSDVPGQNEETVKKDVPLRMSGAELKRFNWLLGHGHSLAAAHELCRFPVGTASQQKRQRSEDQSSPNTSGQPGPQKKRSKDSQKPGPGVTFKEMAVALPIAITTVDYPETRLSREQLAVLKEALVTAIGNLVNPPVRPNFRNCDFKQGYLLLACGDAGTASWLKEVAATLTPWEGAALKAIEAADLPKLHPFTAYVFDSCNDSTSRILQLMENQNSGLSTKSWRVVTRKTVAKTVELLLEVDEKSADTIEANNSLLNYKFGKARLRKVTGGAPTAKRRTSVAQTLSNPAKGGTVQLNGDKGVKAKPNTSKAKQHQPTASSTNADTGTGSKAASGSTTQPPGTSNSQKPFKGKGRKPVTPSSRAQGDQNEGLKPPHIGDKAVGNRQPTLGSSGQRAENGAPPGQ